MFERFTDRSRRVVVLAQEQARLLGHNYIGTEHILLGLLDEEGVAQRALAGLGLDRDKAAAAVEETVGRGSGTPSGHIPFTPRAKKVLELSLREAMQLNHNYIGTEHILLGLLRENDGVGAAVLRSSGADIRTLRQKVIELAREADDEPMEQRDSLSVTSVSAPSAMSLVARSEEEHPLCPICASSLAETLKWRRVTAAGEGDEREALVTYCGSCGRALGVLT